MYVYIYILITIIVIIINTMFNMQSKVITQQTKQQQLLYNLKTSNLMKIKKKRNVLY